MSIDNDNLYVSSNSDDSNYVDDSNGNSISEYDNNSIVNTVRRRRGKNGKMQKFGEENVEPGDNARYLRYAMVSMNLPPIDISDPKQVEQRINDYFCFCIQNDRKPNMVGMANWIGVDRDTVKTWKSGEYRGATHSAVIRKAVDILEELWIDYMQNGKINPASGIFLGKNMFGYRDVIDIAPTTANPLGDVKDQKQLESRIEGSVAVDD